MVRLVTVLVAQGRLDEARTWAARHRREFPSAPPEGVFEDLESGMAEAVGFYHAGRFRDAGERFARIVAAVPEGSPTRRRARYFLALTLFRQYDVDAALREADAYRARYGIDDAAIELEYRNAEARLLDPETAAKLFAALRAAHPNTAWATEATRHLKRLDPTAVSESGG